MSSPPRLVAGREARRDAQHSFEACQCDELAEVTADERQAGLNAGALGAKGRPGQNVHRAQIGHRDLPTVQEDHEVTDGTTCPNSSLLER